MISAEAGLVDADPILYSLELELGIFLTAGRAGRRWRDDGPTLASVPLAAWGSDLFEGDCAPPLARRQGSGLRRARRRSRWFSFVE